MILSTLLFLAQSHDPRAYALALGLERARVVLVAATAKRPGLSIAHLQLGPLGPPADFTAMVRPSYGLR